MLLALVDDLCRSTIVVTWDWRFVAHNIVLMRAAPSIGTMMDWLRQVTNKCSCYLDQCGCRTCLGFRAVPEPVRVAVSSCHRERSKAILVSQLMRVTTRFVQSRTLRG